MRTIFCPVWVVEARIAMTAAINVFEKNIEYKI
jgi:hypothetical protein